VGAPCGWRCAAPATASTQLRLKIPLDLAANPRARAADVCQRIGEKTKLANTDSHFRPPLDNTKQDEEHDQFQIHRPVISCAAIASDRKDGALAVVKG
jgi:hypothetical protein